jgi:hypothetical protein
VSPDYSYSFKVNEIFFIRYFVGPCHHGTALFQVTVLGDVNKQSRTARKGCSSSLRVGREGGGSQFFTVKTECYEMLHIVSDSADSCEHGSKYSASTEGGEYLDQLRDI